MRPPILAIVVAVAAIWLVYGVGYVSGLLSNDPPSLDSCTRTMTRTYENDAAPEGPTQGSETEVTTWICP